MPQYSLKQIEEALARAKCLSDHDQARARFQVLPDRLELVLPPVPEDRKDDEMPPLESEDSADNTKAPLRMKACLANAARVNTDKTLKALRDEIQTEINKAKVNGLKNAIWGTKSESNAKALADYFRVQGFLVDVDWIVLESCPVQEYWRLTITVVTPV